MTDEVKNYEQEVREAEERLAEAKRAAAHQEYPKYVEAHASHVVTTGDHVSTPHFLDFHVGRDGKVMVLVKDAEDEAKALAAKIEKEVE